jgi:proliferating cell nuclear antigen
MSADSQSRLVGDLTGDAVRIDTSGRVIRPLLAPITALLDEAKLHFDADGLSVTGVDPANVGLLDLHAPPAAFDSYDHDGAVTVGSPVGTLATAVSDARLGKSTDDPVALRLSETSTTVDVTREYDGTTLTQSGEHLNIDPDSIREEPDIPDLDLPATATCSPSAFKAAVQHVDAVADHAVVTAADGQLVIAAEHEDATGQYGTAAQVDVPVDGLDEPVRSTFSLDYLTDIARALVKAKVDTVTLRFGDEFPLRAAFERTADETTLYEGEFALAPRIGSDSP